VRTVVPEVFIVSRPSLDLDAIGKYLTEVGGMEWLRRLDNGQEIIDGEALVEFGGRLCYRSWEPGLNANVTKIREDSSEYLENILRSGHGSVVEHAHYSFVLHNVSRVFTHELCRHRHENISQESMRFVRLTDIPFWFPEWAMRDTDLMLRSLGLLKQMEDHQHWMAEHFGLDDPGVAFSEKKHKTSFMRRFAPDGVATGMLWTANLRGIRHIVTMRTDSGAEEEIRLVFSKLMAMMKEEAPAIFTDMERQEDGTWMPTYRKV
jgi:thymidylate synthase (FAD)